jgi:protein involved in ribonucleotide reduction
MYMSSTSSSDNEHEYVEHVDDYELDIENLRAQHLISKAEFVRLCVEYMKKKDNLYVEH